MQTKLVIIFCQALISDSSSAFLEHRCIYLKHWLWMSATQRLTSVMARGMTKPTMETILREIQTNNFHTSYRKAFTNDTSHSLEEGLPGPF